MLRSWPTFGMPAARDIGHIVDANADAWLFWLFWTLPILSLALVWRRWQRGDERWPGELAAVAAIAGLAAGINAGFLRDVLRTRLADAIVPAALLGAWLLGRSWTAAGPPWVTRRAAHAIAALVLAVSLVAVGSVAEFHEQLERSGIDNGPRAVLGRIGQRSQMLSQPHRQPLSAPSRVSGALMPFFEYLDRCTAPSERLIVTGEFPDVLVLAGRGFAGDGVVFGAWYASAARQDRTVDRLRARPALFVIAVDQKPFRQRFPVIAGFIDERYAPFAELEREGVRVAILVDRHRETTGSDGVTDWGCYR